MVRVSIVVYKIAQPPAHDDCLNYKEYKKRLELWISSAEPPITRTTSLVIESITNNSKFKTGLVNREKNEESTMEVKL